MNKTYKVKYIIDTEIEAENDKEAKEIIVKNADAIFRNGEFWCKRVKIITKVIDE